MTEEKMAKFNKLPKAVISTRISFESLTDALKRAKRALEDFAVYAAGYRAGYKDALNQQPNKLLH